MNPIPCKRIVLLALLLAFMGLLLPGAAVAGANEAAGTLIYCRAGSLYAAAITRAGDLFPGKHPYRIARLPHHGELQDISVSADGRLIVLGIYTRRDDSRSLWMMANRPRATLQRLGPGADPAFAPTGKRLAYTAVNFNSDRWQNSVRIRDFADGKITAFRPHAHTPRWSADGTEITLIDESQADLTATVLVVDAATGKQVQFRKDAINVDTPLLSPDGRYVAYNPELSRPKLPGVIADLQTGNEVILPHEGAPVLDWSADSRWLLWMRYIIDPRNDGAWSWQEVWATTADGKRSYRVGAGTSGRFAPDSKHILYVRTSAEEDPESMGLYVADLQDHRRTLLPECDEVFTLWQPQRRGSPRR